MVEYDAHGSIRCGHPTGVTTVDLKLKPRSTGMLRWLHGVRCDMRCDVRYDVRCDHDVRCDVLIKRKRSNLIL